MFGIGEIHSGDSGLHLVRIVSLRVVLHAAVGELCMLWRRCASIRVLFGAGSAQQHLVEALHLRQRHLQQEALHHQLFQVLAQTCPGEKRKSCETAVAETRQWATQAGRATLTLQWDAPLLSVEDSLTVARPFPLGRQTRGLCAQHQKQICICQTAHIRNLFPVWFVSPP